LKTERKNKRSGIFVQLSSSQCIDRSDPRTIPLFLKRDTVSIIHGAKEKTGKHRFTEFFVRPRMPVFFEGPSKLIFTTLPQQIPTVYVSKAVLSISSGSIRVPFGNGGETGMNPFRHNPSESTTRL
jgi:hypothetical protein